MDIDFLKEEDNFLKKEDDLTQIQENKKICEDDLTSIIIPIHDIEHKSFETRKDLGNRLREWSRVLLFRLIFCTRERYLKTDQTWISRMECAHKNCPFFVEFEKNSTTMNQYMLTQYHNIHNHQLEDQNGGLEITDEILDKIIEYRALTSDAANITKKINSQFKSNFSVQTIRYQLKKIKDVEYGQPSEDAKKLMEMLAEEKNKGKIFYEKKVNEENQLVSFCFMTQRMIDLTKKFSDVIIADTTFKTNRFGLPLLDLICINNLGRSCTIFVALLENSKETSFNWALEQFKKATGITPKIVFSDEEDALRNGMSLFFFIIFFLSI